MSLPTVYWGRLRMQEFEITILLPKSQGETEKSITRYVKEGTTFHALAGEVAQAYPERFDGPIMLANFENKIREMEMKLNEPKQSNQPIIEQPKSYEYDNGYAPKSKSKNGFFKPSEQ